VDTSAGLSVGPVEAAVAIGRIGFVGVAAGGIGVEQETNMPASNITNAKQVLCFIVHWLLKSLCFILPFCTHYYKKQPVARRHIPAGVPISDDGASAEYYLALMPKT